jgi:hypothetical protein
MSNDTTNFKSRSNNIKINLYIRNYIFGLNSMYVKKQESMSNGIIWHKKLHPWFKFQFCTSKISKVGQPITKFYSASEITTL